MMNNDQKEILANVVMDPDAWYANAVDQFGEEQADLMAAQKAERHREAWEIASAQPGYKTRAEREDE